MSAGHGIEHSEYNASDAEPAHFLQIWIQPDRLNAAPDYAQKAFDPAARRAQWGLLASPDGAEGSLAIRQDARLLGVQLGNGESVTRPLETGRRYWLQIVQGDVRAGDQPLAAGDAIGYASESGELRMTGAGAGPLADILLFDLPG